MGDENNRIGEKKNSLGAVPPPLEYGFSRPDNINVEHWNKTQSDQMNVVHCKQYGKTI